MMLQGDLPSAKPEFPPLLPVGRHLMSLEELRALCVDRFPLSTTRDKITGGLQSVVDRLLISKISGELWVDGSFVTEKTDPVDVDIVLRIPAEAYENGTDKQRKAIDWLNGDLKDSHYCDSYCFMEWPPSHPLYWYGEYMYTYWMKWYGFSRGEEMKGIAVIPLPGGEA